MHRSRIGGVITLALASVRAQAAAHRPRLQARHTFGIERRRRLRAGGRTALRIGAAARLVIHIG
jgi:hypothetical protein